MGNTPLPDKLPELLAPAGSIEAGITALDAGADAVYAGLPRFNARERGQNLTAEQLSKLIGYAHKGGRKVYVTLNTLMKEHELAEVAPFLVDLAVLRPDAVIVQDLGLVRLFRERLPELEVHASTQMGIHNSAGLSVAERLGIRRVILERQTTFEEIETMSRRTSLELEVFIHGALCCSRSGVCLFSSWMGGWSGNRGKCKQPCRRRYHGEEGNGFFFSPCDLYSLDDLPRLRRMGVASLKIEGRLRKPDYVRRVVTAYRKALDASTGGKGADLGEARAELSGALGRKWSAPFHSIEDFEGVIRHEAMGGSGLMSGNVLRSGKTGFEVKVTRPLHLYDTIRVQPRSGDEGPSLTISHLEVGKRRVKGAKKGEKCWIVTDAKVETGAVVYKTGSATADLHERVARLPEGRAVLDLEVTLRDETITVSIPLFGSKWTAAAPLSPAKNRPLEAAAVEAELRRTRSDSLAAGLVEVDVEAGVFLPASSLKGLRREFWEWVAERASKTEVHQRWEERLASDGNEQLPAESDGGAPPETVVLVSKREQNPIPGAVTARGLLEPNAHAMEVVLPDLCGEADLHRYRSRVEEAYAAGIRRFRVTSLYGFSLLDGLEGLSIATSFPLPVCNSLAVDELRALGARKVGAWVELERKSLTELIDRARGPMEVLTYGRLPILSTRMVIPASGRITDGRGAGFTIERRSGLTSLFPEKALSIPAPEGVSQLVDLTHAEWGEGETSAFNLDRDLA